MSVDVFISYAWTSPQHREWVRLLAAHLRAIGYSVLIDAAVDYGDSLSGFMRRVVDARHVLLIVDTNYVVRADSLPDSGVGRESESISEAHPQKPSSWLSAIFKDNATLELPAWLSPHNPKGFSFNSDPSRNSFPGSEQVEEIWRWLEGLPADREHAIPLAVMRERATRLERIEVLRDPGSWRDPRLEGEVHFEYAMEPSRTFRVGVGQYEFGLAVSSHSRNAVYVLADPVKAVGLIRSVEPSGNLAKHLTPGRSVVAHEGSAVVLMNQHGALCRVNIVAVQHEENGESYIAPYVDFSYRVLTDS